ncbi:major facilitator superfamily domain-containing protein [Limtongia smithiae]|uniref:major facilitator superfamily domain-containing protein n=1 Tax=Limtongia smithiae TaxID=1125753 RepID=UPI0034CDDA3D
MASGVSEKAGDHTPPVNQSSSINTQVPRRPSRSVSYASTVSRNGAVNGGALPRLRQRSTTQQLSTVDNDDDDSSARDYYLARIPTVYNASDEDELQRVITAKSIHQETVGQQVKPAAPLVVPFGRGRSYPPMPPDIDIYLVDFDGVKDPMHPQNWHIRQKVTVMVVLGFATFVVAWGSSIFSPTTTTIQEIYGVGHVVATLAISLYVLGFASGPLLWGPCSELYGRKLPVVISMFIFAIFHLAVARAHDLQTIMICRFFAGFFGASCLAVVPAAFADMFGNKTRGTAIAIFSANVFTAPIIAPVVGSFIVNSYLGWRWTEYLTCIMAFCAFILVALFMKETFAPQVLVDKAEYLRRTTGNWCIRAQQEERVLDFEELVERNVSRPIRMLITEPILALVSIYTAFIYGILYLLLEAYPIIFYEGYGMEASISSLPYLGLAIGQTLGCILVISFEPMTYRRVLANGGRVIPELRLIPCIIGSLFFTAGLFWLTWTGAYHQSVPWIVPTLSGLFTGIGLISIFLTALNYIIESYLVFAASAVAANTFIRSAFGAAFPLFGTALFHNLHTQWAGTLLGCLAMILLPVPVLFYAYGARLRKVSKYAPDLS